VDEMIAYCGYNCALCAARSEDPEVRQKMVDGWRRIFGHEHYTAENVFCVGCRAEGPHADQQCTARPCVIETGLESCADCDEFPCQKVGRLLGSSDGLLIFCALRAGDVTREEYDLCMRQFDSMPNIVARLVENGRLGKWVAEMKKAPEDAEAEEE